MARAGAAGSTLDMKRKGADDQSGFRWTSAKFDMYNSVYKVKR